MKNLARALLLAGLLGLTWRLNRTRRTLTQLNLDLETQMQARTAMLSQTTIRLQAEIAERERTAEAFRQSQTRWQTILNTSLDGIAIASISGVLEYVSDKLLARHGYDQPADMVGRSMFEFLDATSHDTARLKLTELLNGHYSDVTEYRLIKKDGSRFFMEINAEVLRDDQGAPVSIFFIERDITARKQAEEALRASEIRFRNLYENAPVGIFHSLPAGRFLRVNPALVAMLGYASPEDMLASVTDIGVQLFADPTQRPKILAVILHQDNWFKDELLLRRKDGSIVVCDLAGRRVLNSDGSIAYLEGFVQDITARKRAEAALRESEQRLNDVIASNVDGMLVIDQACRVALVNPAAADMLHCTAPELMGTEFGYVVAPVPGEITVPFDNVRVTLEMRAIDLVWNGAPAQLVTVRDITERKRLEEQLQQQATTDELTGVSNRRHFLRLAAQELKRVARRHHSLALAIIDLDHFKQINDTYGHAAGDQALVAFAGICQTHLREIDLFARFGGDEFALLLPETHGEQAYAAIERVRQILAAGPLDLAGRPVALTISAGIACSSSAHEPLDALLARADQALYRAKAAGRNRTVGPDAAGPALLPLAPDLAPDL